MGRQGHLRGRGVVLLSIVVVACSSPTPPTAPPSTTTPSTTSPASSASGQPTAPEPSPSGPAPSASSSQGLIAADFAAGAIDVGTSLELRAWALFGDPRLPERYDGGGSIGEDQQLFKDIGANLDSLPADKRDELSRYLLRPTDPNSPFSSAPAPAARSAGRFELAQAEATPEPHQCTAPRRWFDEPWSPDGNVDHGFKAWACGPSRATVQGDLDRVIAIGAELWPKMTVPEPNGMGPPVPDTDPPATATPAPSPTHYDDGSGKIDVYLVEPLAECRMRSGTCEPIPVDSESGQAAAAAVKDGDRCTVYGFPDKGCSGFMLLRRDRVADPEFQADFAHEFFHLLQFAHNGYADATWYDEASAVWAEWYYENSVAKPGTDLHFQAYQQANWSLLWYRYQQLFQYQAWGWPLFQFTEKGPSAIFQTWKAIENTSSPEQIDAAIDAQLPFEGTFRDFAVRNAQPTEYIEGASTGLDEYIWQTRPTQPALTDFPIDQHVLTGKRATVVMGKFSRAANNIQPLAAQYDQYLVNDNDIAQITIDITGLTGAAHADLDAVGQVVTEDNWHRFKSSSGKLTLCREKADQNVIGVLDVVISNHALARKGDGPNDDQDVKGDYTIEAKDKCEEQDVMLHGTFIGHGEDSLQTSDATFNVDIVWHRPDNPNDPLNFELVSGSFTFDTTVVGVCAGTLGEGGNLEPPSTGNSQGLTYGDASQGSHYASVTLRDSRLDNGTVAFFLVAKFDLPNSSSECQPPFEPYGYIPQCPPQFKVLPDGTLETDATCEDSVGTKWTGHLAGQQ